MNRLKNWMLSSTVLLILSIASCRKIIDCTDHNPPPAPQPSCKVVSTSELVHATITIPPPDTCTVDCEERYIVDTLILAVKHFYYNSKGDPDSIVFRNFGPDTTLLDGASMPKSLYFAYDGQGRLISKVEKNIVRTDSFSYVWVDAHTITQTWKFSAGTSTGTIKLDDSSRVINDEARTYEYDSSGNLILNPYNDYSLSNEALEDIGSYERLTYDLSKLSPRRTSWVFMFIDRDFSKNTNDIFSSFNTFGYAQRFGGPGHKYPPGYQDVLFGDIPNGADWVDTGDRSIQYECTEAPSSVK